MSSCSLPWRMISSASSRLVGLRVLLRFEGLVEEMEHRNDFRAIRRPLTLNYIAEGGDQNRPALEFRSCRSVSQAVERTHAVYLAGEVDL